VVVRPGKAGAKDSLSGRAPKLPSDLFTISLRSIAMLPSSDLPTARLPTGLRLARVAVWTGCVIVTALLWGCAPMTAPAAPVVTAAPTAVQPIAPAAAVAGVQTAAHALSAAPGPNFDQTPGALPKTVWPQQVTAHLNLDPDRLAYTGDVQYQLRVRAPVQSITMHARGLTVTDAKVNGTAVAVTLNAKDTQVTFTLPQPLPPGDHVLSLNFAGKVSERNESLHRVPARGGKAKHMLATDMEPIGARSMLPMFDEPAFRTVWAMSVTAPKRYQVIGNMPVAKRAAVGKAHQRVTFEPTPSMPSYLLALMVGEFDQVSTVHEGVALTIYTQPGEAHRAKLPLQWTQQILTHLQTYFGVAYGLPKLDQIAVPTKRGAMENWGLIAYSDEELLLDPKTLSSDQAYWAFNTIAHEIVHQWFGNLVTVAWWDDLWLKESFAQWLAEKTTMALQPTWNVGARRIGERERAMQADELATTRPIQRAIKRDDETFDSYDAISYEKGSQVLNMLEQYVGDAAWRSGLQTYLQQHRMGAARADDLWAALAQASNKPVPNFAKAWIGQSGFPVAGLRSSCQGGVQQLQAEPSRFLLKPDYAPAQNWSMNLRLRTLGGEQRDVPVEGAPVVTALGGCNDTILADPGSNGYFRVRYDDSLQAKLLQAYPKLPVEDQQRLLGDAWALAKVGQVPVQRSFDLMAALPLSAAAHAWRRVVNVVDAMLLLTHGTPQHAAVRQQALKILTPKWKVMGWTARSPRGVGARGQTDPNAGADADALRGDLIDVLARLGDATVVKEARRRFVARDRDASALRGGLGGGVVKAVGAHATVADWNTLASMHQDKRWVGLRWDLSVAIGSPKDPAVMRHAMQGALNGQVPGSAVRRHLMTLAQSSGKHREVWQFVQQHKPALFAKVGEWGQRGLYPAALQDSRDVALGQEVQAAAQRDLGPSMQAAAARALDAVQRNAWGFEAVAKGLR
jgi:puromycin-sensitive aminopeptidase